MPDLTPTLPAPDSQPLTARLAGAGSLRRELEQLLSVSPADASAEDYRRLLIEENAAGKASANARMWMWKRLKLRYALDTPMASEVRAFRWAMAHAHSPTDRGVIAALMMARTDRLFREVTTEIVAPVVSQRGKVVGADRIRSSVETRMTEAGLAWSGKSLTNVANHLLSSLKDFGIVEGSRERRTVGVRITPTVATFAVHLGRAEGLTDRKVLESRWFSFLGADARHAAEALHAAAKEGLMTFRMQADVVELHLPDLGDVA
jgi:hypothetical protein